MGLVSSDRLIRNSVSSGQSKSHRKNWFDLVSSVSKNFYEVIDFTVSSVKFLV